MPTRRQEKVARVVREAVSDAVANHLGDPRITGFVSVTGVDLSPNLRHANIHLSIFGGDEKTQRRTFIAIEHARTKIQSLVAKRITGKFCPVLKFQMDEKLKKTMEVMGLIDQVSRELHEEDQPDEQSDGQ